MFVQVLNRGVSLHGRRLTARNWVFSYTPEELCEEVEQLADAANKTYHEGFGGGKNAQDSSQNGANGGSKKVNDTKGVKQACGISLLLSSTSRAMSHSTENHRWSVHEHKIIGGNVSTPHNQDRNAR